MQFFLKKWMVIHRLDFTKQQRKIKKKGLQKVSKSYQKRKRKIASIWSHSISKTKID